MGSASIACSNSRIASIYAAGVRFVPVVQSLQIVFVSEGIDPPVGKRPAARRFHLAGNFAGYGPLPGEQVAEFFLVAFRPYLRLIVNAQQTHIDSHTPARSRNASLDDKLCAQLAADLFHCYQWVP